MQNMLYRSSIVLVLALSAVGCRTVKQYQAQHLKDHDMQPNALAIEKLENEADSYREGAAGGNGGKSGGGCGCN